MEENENVNNYTAKLNEVKSWKRNALDTLRAVVWPGRQ